MPDAETRALIDRFAAPVPRYTSYPTAPHFHDGIDARTYASWLAALPPDASLSLYVHVPFCDRLCWFCGCHTKHTLRYAPVATYLEALLREIDWVAAQTGGRGTVTALHLGGGSPTMLSPGDMARLRQHLVQAFGFAPDAEISIEIDPNELTEAQLDAMAEFGLTRASLGVQDFEPRVQEAINRLQTFEQTRFVVDGVRRRGVRSVNLDALYGLPYQTVETIERTMDQVLSLQPDRVALFGYAHVPWMKPHQKMIATEALPGAVERFEQARSAARKLTDAGLQPIGMDHFARPGDSLARAAADGRLRRNFQGYTDDRADALIGLGASSIGRLPQGYVQNITATGEYERTVLDGNGPVARGYALTEEDRIRAAAIEALMCDFVLSADRLGDAAPVAAVMAEAERIGTADPDGLVEWDGESLRITERGRPFVRSFAARFDRHLGQGPGRHSTGV